MLFRLFEAVRARHQTSSQISIKVRASYGINEGEWRRTWRDLGLEQEYNHQRGLIVTLDDIYQRSTINAV